MSADLDLLNEGIRQFNATGGFDLEMLERHRLELPFGAIWTFSEAGGLARVDSFPSYDEAIAAAEA